MFSVCERNRQKCWRWWAQSGLDTSLVPPLWSTVVRALGGREHSVLWILPSGSLRILARWTSRKQVTGYIEYHGFVMINCTKWSWKSIWNLKDLNPKLYSRVITVDYLPTDHGPCCIISMNEKEDKILTFWYFQLNVSELSEPSPSRCLINMCSVILPSWSMFSTWDMSRK